MSISPSFFYRCLGRPTLFYPLQLHLTSFFDIFSLSILIICPIHLKRCVFTTLTIRDSLKSSYISLFVLLFHEPFSTLPLKIFHKIFLSYISIFCVSSFLMIHTSHSNITIDLISVLHICIFSLLHVLLCFSIEFKHFFKFVLLFFFLSSLFLNTFLIQMLSLSKSCILFCLRL